MKYIILAPVSVVVLLCLLSTGEGCLCAGGVTVCRSYAEASAVFVGIVSDISLAAIRRDEASGGDVLLPKVVRFSVEEVYKGVGLPEVCVETDGNGDGDCAYPFEAGKRYLVYAYGSSKGKLGTGICSRTKLLTEASEDLDYLRGLPESALMSRISGTLIQLINEPDRTGFRKAQRMSGIKVTVTGGSREFEALTDDQGVFKVIGLPSGKYTIRPVLPANLRLERWDGKGFMEAVVPPGGCAAVILTVETDGGIAGRILDSSGKPAEGVRVDLVPVKIFGTSAAEVVESSREKSDADGGYRFKGISPGRYYLGINLRNEPSADLPYDRTYYSGTRERERATIIELKEGEKLAGFDLFLPPPIPLRPIEGVFLWSNGQPVKPGAVYLKDSAEATSSGRVYSSAQVDDKGHFSIQAFDELECWVHASTYYSYGERMQFVDIEPVKIVVNPNTPSLRLIAPMPSDPGGKKVNH